jgi:hypothetical protein
MIWVVAAGLIFVALILGVLSPYLTESHKLHERLRRLSPRKARRVAKRAENQPPRDDGSLGGAGGTGLEAWLGTAAGGLGNHTHHGDGGACP